MNVVIIQPPLVQLNTPYPSGAYLQSFFKSHKTDFKIDGKIEWIDFSIQFFHKIFCKKGLEKLFEESSKKALKIANDAENHGDDNTAFQLRRYISQKNLWCEWIDQIIAILCPEKTFSGREFVHEFVRSAHAPRGNRMEQYLSGLGRDVCVDDSRILASLALADLADYITAVYDNEFALIRYAERLAVSTATFDEALEGLKGPVLEKYFKPLLEENLSVYKNEKTLYCISISFPGCFEAALYTAKYLKESFGNNALVAFGGGYINTELRNLKEKRIFDYCDFISYDKGYGSYFNLFEENFNFNGKKFYKVKYLYNDEIINFEEKSEKFEKLEIDTVHSLVPDFTTVDFSLYPRMADDVNPMHRIWNDGSWIKAYMAYGCYWHRCAFCDTQLDYVKGYCGTNVSDLYDGLFSQAQKTGVFGIHFVDEACPPKAMQLFALKNLCRKQENQKGRITWWGNIRFEKTFSRDLADLLSFGGLTAVSGGIEIATGSGLDSVNKGTTIEHIVSACCAFKEAGILVHSYMIFGFWNQSEQDLIDSMETLRQLFSAGLLDSAFWHKFSLTLNSTVYKEWAEGKHPELKPIASSKNQFAENALNYEGEESSEKYSAPLNQALEFWMHGEKLKKNVESYFPYKMPKPSIPHDFIERLIEKYEHRRDEEFKTAGDKTVIWLGGDIIILKAGKGFQLCWSYMGELLYADINDLTVAEKTVELAKKISAAAVSGKSDLCTADDFLKISGKALYSQLRGKGLCALM